MNPEAPHESANISKTVAKEKKQKISLKEKVQKFWDDMWDINKQFNGFIAFAVNVVKVVTVTTHKFLSDDGLAKASSIAYTTIVSLIPTLTVGFSLFSAFGGLGTKKEELIRMADQYIKEHNMNIDISPFANAIISVTDNAAGIGGVGLLVLIFSATAVLRTLEKIFNDIWKIEVQRSILMKVIYYWGALTLGPLLLATGGSLAGIMANIFTMPTIYEVKKAGNQMIAVGDRGYLAIADRHLKKVHRIDFSAIDFENQRRLLIDKDDQDATLKIVPPDEYTINAIDEKFLKGAWFLSVASANQYIWVVSHEGIILYSQNAGKSWHVTQVGKINFTGNFDGLNIKDIHFVNQDTGYITAAGFVLLKTTDRGRTWFRVNLDMENADLTILNSTLTKIFFKTEKEGYILTSKGAYLYTKNGGETWKLVEIEQAQFRKRPLELLDIDANSFQEIWIVGSEGLILYSDNNGKSFKKRSKGEFNYNAVVSLGKKKAVIAGDEGYLVYTADAGDKWQRKKFGSWNYFSLFLDSKEIVSYGENMSIHVSPLHGDAELNWARISGGKNFWYSMINFLAPFAVIWILFIVAYITLPNTKVPVKPAAIGASITSAVWVIFILSFTYYVKNLTGGTQAIYGALAIIPIFLLMVYASAVILLYGAEITYTLQHPSTYRSKRSFNRLKLEEHYLYDGVNVLFTIFSNFDAGKGATNSHALQKLINSEQEVLPFLLTLFTEKGYIKETTEAGEYLPNMSGSLILLDEVVDLVLAYSYQIPNFKASDPVMKFFKEKFDMLEKYRDGIFHEYSMERLVREVGKKEIVAKG